LLLSAAEPENATVPRDEAADAPERAEKFVSISDPAEVVAAAPDMPKTTLTATAPGVVVAETPGMTVPSKNAPGDDVAAHPTRASVSDDVAEMVPAELAAEIPVRAGAVPCAETSDPVDEVADIPTIVTACEFASAPVADVADDPASALVAASDPAEDEALAPMIATESA
jgi:hypothetical protein